ncbi:UdgX family uracil-DNA binding protein [Marilutibacter spongiae]|uniref:Type-4 uracil-DNA glycosylase n=1 Tax=Marilutibacter spongiae TaxID=2025720 RepID=A0A7W3TJL3_9GAMM|nr:UdgX family uracil-DNA binding protein [Lysobacter spongiae]MBB1059553.1 UdgX family uracil-DNA binding protein [Lysobacter spongiae]
MRRVSLDDGADLAEWRQAARGLLADGIAPEHVLWDVGAQADLLGALAAPGQGLASGARPVPAVAQAKVPAAFLSLAGRVIAHADPRRHAVLYRLLWRLVHGERALLGMATDDDVAWAADAAKAVNREKHKMKAFVRLREVQAADGSVYVAWFEPVHDVLAQVAPFFARRFAGMRWSILTPLRSAHWDGQALRLGPGAERADAPDGDALEALWRVYYANIFNPARLKVDAMVKEMPVRYWKNLPEAALIPGLIREAGGRMQAMVDAAPTTPRRAQRAPARTARDVALPMEADALAAAVRSCRQCALWRPATQAVPGEGPVDARVMVVGEQPGDAEDLAGRPFVGPAGRLLDEALVAAGLDRAGLYLTNAVKHFKFQPRGKRRLHARASAAEQSACRPWLQAELERVKPRFVLCLGNTAARALLGAGVSVNADRGVWHASATGAAVMPTFHPAYLLRLPVAEREAAWAAFVADLAKVREACERDGPV